VAQSLPKTQSTLPSLLTAEHRRHLLCGVQCYQSSCYVTVPPHAGLKLPTVCSDSRLQLTSHCKLVHREPAIHSLTYQLIPLLLIQNKRYFFSFEVLFEYQFVVEEELRWQSVMAILCSAALLMYGSQSLTRSVGGLLLLCSRDPCLNNIADG
jgi:hypothetical protein